MAPQRDCDGLRLLEELLLEEAVPPDHHLVVRELATRIERLLRVVLEDVEEVLDLAALLRPTFLHLLLAGRRKVILAMEDHEEVLVPVPREADLLDEGAHIAGILGEVVLDGGVAVHTAVNSHRDELLELF